MSKTKEVRSKLTETQRSLSGDCWVIGKGCVTAQGPEEHSEEYKLSCKSESRKEVRACLNISNLIVSCNKRVFMSMCRHQNYDQRSIDISQPPLIEDHRSGSCKISGFDGCESNYNSKMEEIYSSQAISTSNQCHKLEDHKLKEEIIHKIERLRITVADSTAVK
jgi:hypothetical protein